MLNKKKLEKKRFILPKDGDLSAISIVTSPAIESSSKYFSNEKAKQVYKFEKTKLQITGPAMIPDKLMLREDSETKEYFMGYFTSEDIQECSKRFFKNGNNIKANFEHSKKFNKNIFAFESWIVSNPENDKSNALGFKDVVEGTWFITYQFENEKDYEYAINNGFTGFSVEVDAFTYSSIDEPNEFKFELNQFSIDLETKIKWIIATDKYNDDQKEIIIKQLMKEFK